MRLYFKTTLTIKIFLWIIAAISLIGLVVGIMALAGAHIEVTRGQGVLLISVCSFAMFVSALLGTIHYKVDAEHIHLNIAFIDMLSNRIRIDKILNIVIENGNFYISYLWRGADPVIALLSISPKRYNDLKEYLMAHNPNIIFYEAKDNGTTDSEQQ